MADLIDTVHRIHRREDDEFVNWIKEQNKNPDSLISQHVFRDALTTIKFIETPIKKDKSDMDELLIRYKRYKDHELARIKYNIIESILDKKKLYIIFAFPYNHNVHNCWNELTWTWFTVIVEHREVDDKIQDVMKDGIY